MHRNTNEKTERSRFVEAICFVAIRFHELVGDQDGGVEPGDGDRSPNWVDEKGGDDEDKQATSREGAFPGYTALPKRFGELSEHNSLPAQHCALFVAMSDAADEEGQGHREKTEGRDDEDEHDNLPRCVAFHHTRPKEDPLASNLTAMQKFKGCLHHSCVCQQAAQHKTPNEGRIEPLLVVAEHRLACVLACPEVRGHVETTLSRPPVPKRPKGRMNASDGRDHKSSDASPAEDKEGPEVSHGNESRLRNVGAEAHCR
mmetsp:Transcript_75867/g.178051  ORF Transcript_75867/g.178051 Transcript_75867/m.178051 type:complete len:258 (-) Transcript_75867:320-1093(-)